MGTTLVAGNCLKDYIYFGADFVAEYDPPAGQYYYYTQDETNSTRIVTNDSGAIVYAKAHDPYGGIQQTWESVSFEPTPEFASKERDKESGMDYFGARYYDNPIYRWISVDPALNMKAAITNPQLWNLYAYCNNNPVNLKDVNGDVLEVDWDTYLELCDIFEPYGIYLTFELVSGKPGILRVKIDRSKSNLENVPVSLEPLVAAIDEAQMKFLITQGQSIKVTIRGKDTEIAKNTAEYYYTRNDRYSPETTPQEDYVAVVGINPKIIMGNFASGKVVSTRALIYHALIEVIRICLYLQPRYAVPPFNAHYYSGLMELRLLKTWPGFTEYPAGAGPGGPFTGTQEPKKLYTLP